MQSHFPNTHTRHTGGSTLLLSYSYKQRKTNVCVGAAGRQVFHRKPSRCTQSLKLSASTVCRLSTPFVRRIPENIYPECTTSLLNWSQFTIDCLHFHTFTWMELHSTNGPTRSDFFHYLDVFFFFNSNELIHPMV